ncbi:hypothetical protein HPULCUR_001031 [Helicostylum pulchrum]|uniref:Uncharacterized protein n=1 Tax=Helicostylum pulchrum TaxID=562976 RepID=A0ABP9XLI8_9FUNG
MNSRASKPYIHRCQTEEIILDITTHHLEPEKLVGFVTIISKLDEQEVEIDLTQLDREQLEKQGGSKVKISDYTIQSGHVVNGSATSRLSSAQGPISKAALTEITKKKSDKRKEKWQLIMPTCLNTFEDSVVSSKPKRIMAVHKRRLLEAMLQFSSDNDSSDSSNTIVAFGQKQMNLVVTQNETIVHKKQETIKVQQEIKQAIQAINDNVDDELIDIM